ncbi:LOW QUALITY PROTEIN: lysosomal cobalamin transporter ABCD4 [Procambarus clarkii]|uniref:LOW QUALITY PROTEIN: lysosomal cobalamin transporter ABCD4 n=1 Tax=Procambarus clarkii TaxID=6728 RepID=UPI001E676707|nr:lysosomal cobalamin transporter ABCD4-like [Procambarus clarkii]
MGEPEKDSKNEGFDLHMFRRLWKIIRIIFPGWYSVPSGLFFLLLLLCFLEQYLAYYMGLVPSKYYTVFNDRDKQEFLYLTLKACGLIFSIASVISVKKYIESVLYITWRQILCRAVHRLYFSGINYYSLNILDKTVDNPDQRMTQDVDKLCLTLATITTKVIISPFQIGYYTYKVFVGTGWLGTLSIYGLFFLGSVVNKLVMSPVVRFVIKQEKCEGNFRFKHMQVRVNSESISFHVSGLVESFKTNQSLDTLIRSQQKLFNRQIMLNMTRYVFDYLGSIISYLAIAIPIFGGKFGDTKDISSIVSAYSFICIYLVYSLTSLVDLGSQVVLLSGVTHRVAQLVECLLKLQTEWDITTLQASSSFANITQNLIRRPDVGEGCSSDSRCLLDENTENEPTVCEEDQKPINIAFILNDVDIIAPGSTKPLVTNLDLHIHKGENLLIMGPSSSGKSSILRILGGLWPAARGTVAHDFPPGPKSVIFLPQKSLLTNGSLLEQIIYPLRQDPNNPISNDTCEDILNLLDSLHMRGLVNRSGGLNNDPEWNWSDALSPGEMQRVCFLRLLYHRPQFAFLDEATSALSLDVEEQLYKACLQHNITLVSVGHRHSLTKYHNYLITLDGTGGWKKEPICQEYNGTELCTQNEDAKM